MLRFSQIPPLMSNMQEHEATTTSNHARQATGLMARLDIANFGET